MSASTQTKAISNSNNIFAASSSLLALYNQILSIDAAWTDQGNANVLNALGTAPVKTDGTLDVADTTPNVTHPIDTRVYTALQQTVSSNQIASVKTILDAVVTLVNGSAVTAQTGARGILNSVIGG